MSSPTEKMGHGAGEEEAITEGLDLTLSLGLYLGIALFIAVLAYVIKVLRMRHRPKFQVHLVLHVSNFELCEDVTLWQGNRCPHFLRLPARNTPHNMCVSGSCCRPRLLIEAEDLTINDITTGCSEAVPTSVPVSLFKAWKLRRILHSPRTFCHLEWRHGQAPFPVLMGSRTVDQTVYHSLGDSEDGLQFEYPGVY